MKCVRIRVYKFEGKSLVFTGYESYYASTDLARTLAVFLSAHPEYQVGYAPEAEFAYLPAHYEFKLIKFGDTEE